MQSTVNNKIIKILFVGDTHGDDSTPEKRKDDYATACLEEMSEIVEIADNKQCDLVLHLGDVFHRIEPGPIIRNGYLKILLQSKTPWYTLIGNHDVKHNLEKYYDYSSIKTLIEVGALKNDDSLLDFGIFPIHHTATMCDEIREGFLLDKNYPILAAHISITLSPYFGSFILFDEIQTHSNTKLIVAGHIHDAMSKVRHDGVKFINPGSISRERLNDSNRNKEPQVLYMEYDLEGNIYVEEYIKLNSSKPAEEIFKLDEAQALKDIKHDSEKYIKQISMMNILDDDDDIYESLRKSAKLKSIEDSILEHAIQTLKSVSDN